MKEFKKHLKVSDSVFKKRWKKFKTIKRAYYSLIIVSVFYLLSLISPVFVGK